MLGITALPQPAQADVGKLAAAVVIAIILFFYICASSPMPVAASSTTPITATVPLVRPNTEPLVVPLLQQVKFQNGYAPYIVTVDLPEGNWAQVVLDWTGSVKGVQYDRFYTLWVGDCQILRGTTPEPTAEGVTWHVEKDVTAYAGALHGKKKITVYLPNWVTPEYTGVFAIDATLSFYPADDNHPPTVTYDTIVTITDNPLIPDDLRFTQNTTRQGRRITIPNGVHEATLQIYSTPHATDEFWWTQSDAWREIRVYLDDLLIGVVWPFPYIYTGGINPRLWWGIPAVSTWNIKPYELNLAPFLGLLPGEHQLEIEFVGIQDHWLTTAMLLLKTGTQPVAGNIEVHNISPVQTVPDGTKQRTFTVKGYIDTIDGRTHHELVQTMSFGRTQAADSAGVEHIHQESTTLSTLTTWPAQSPGVAADANEVTSHVVENRQGYTLVAELPRMPRSAQSTRKTMIQQTMEQELRESWTRNGVVTGKATSLLQDQVRSQVTEAWLGYGWSNVSQAEQTLKLNESSGRCYQRTLKTFDKQLIYDDSSTVCPY